MENLSQYFINYLSFLQNDYSFELVVDKGTVNSTDDSLIMLQKNEIDIRIIDDRGQFFLEIRNNSRKKYSEWSSSDLFFPLVLGTIYDDAVLDEKVYPAFLLQNMDEILRLFSNDYIEETYFMVDQFKHARADRLFKLS